MTFRWYGEGNDSITPQQIKQIPGVNGLVWALHSKQAGEVWEVEEIEEARRQIEGAGFNMDVVESVNVHDDIKIGLPSRDKYIENYKTTLRNLAKFGVKVVTYNFMPIFDWTRTDLFHPLPDGSTALFYEKSKIQDDYKEMANYILNNLHGLTFPGWEPERLGKVKDLFAAYEGVSAEKLFDNLVYFLKAIMPVCNQYDIKMAIHPDDPAWPVFGLPRIITNKENIHKMMRAVDDPHNGLTLCTGSLGTDLNNDLPDIIRSLPGRIHFAHVRNLHHFAPGVFEEAAHLSSDGSFDMYEIMKALHDIHFEGPIRPDHGRTVWGEVCMPGYGLYDRAMGATYLNGLWEAICKSSK